MAVYVKLMFMLILDLVVFMLLTSSLLERTKGLSLFQEALLLELVSTDSIGLEITMQVSNF